MRAELKKSLTPEEYGTFINDPKNEKAVVKLLKLKAQGKACCHCNLLLDKGNILPAGDFKNLAHNQCLDCWDLYTLWAQKKLTADEIAKCHAVKRIANIKKLME